MAFRDGLLRRRLAYLIRVLSRVDFNHLFFTSEGKAVKFSNVFPPGSYSVVGNSPILLENEDGSLIDDNDYIIRFSDYKTDGLEKNVGSRITLWVTKDGTKLPQDQVPLLYLPLNNNSFWKKRIEIVKRYGYENLNSFLIFHNNYILKAIQITVGSLPSIGLLILIILSTKYRDVYPFGFTFGPYRGVYHYARKMKPKTNHRRTNEKKIYRFLLESRMLKDNRERSFDLLRDTNEKLNRLIELLNLQTI